MTKKTGVSKIGVRLIWTKYFINLKNWELEHIKRVERIYGQVSKGVQLQKQELLMQ